MDADRIVGPITGVLAHQVGTLPSGAPIDVSVLLLGDRHATPPRGLQVVDLLQLAAATGVCIDVFVESPAIHRAERRHTGTTALDVLNRWLAANRLGPLVRVHAFDTRPTALDTRLHRAVAARHETSAFPDDAWPAGAHYAFFAYLSGVGPQPAGFVDAIDRLLGPELMHRWLDLQRQVSARVRRRASRMPPDDLDRLVRVAFATSRVGPQHRTWGNLLAAASDVYLLLRMLAPYADRPQRAANACGQPERCIVYAGAFHTLHVLRTLHALAHDLAPPPAYPRARSADGLNVADIVVIERDGTVGRSPATIGQLLG